MDGSGLGYGAAAYGLWGVFPLFWPLLEPASALEILAVRIICTLVTVGIGLALMRRLGELRRLSRQSALRLMTAGAIVTVNWGLYIWGVNSHQVVQTSLGYFINPLVSVALGVIFLGERLRKAQWFALGLASCAVVVLTADYHGLPWIALSLAFSFGVYGLIKNQVAARPPEGLFVETAVMTLPALIFLTVLALRNSASFTGHDATASHLLLLAATGPVTAIPLLFFAAAARRLPLTTVGMLQFLAPVMQFLIGVLVRHEPLPPARFIGFALIWLALVLITTEALKHRRALESVVPEPT